MNYYRCRLPIWTLSKHSTQVHRITNIKYRTPLKRSLFVQRRSWIWHKQNEDLIHKINAMLPLQYVEFLATYLSETLVRVKQEE